MLNVLHKSIYLFKVFLQMFSDKQRVAWSARRMCARKDPA